jgi:hypothetical protein
MDVLSPDVLSPDVLSGHRFPALSLNFLRSFSASYSNRDRDIDSDSYNDNGRNQFKRHCNDVPLFKKMTSDDPIRYARKDFEYSINWSYSLSTPGVFTTRIHSHLVYCHQEVF